MCPVCGLAIVPQAVDVKQGALLISCFEGCDQFTLDREQDPLYADFRCWTEQETRVVLERLPAFCPIDGAKLEISVANGQHVARCLRCGNWAAKALSTNRKQPRNRRA